MKNFFLLLSIICVSELLIAQNLVTLNGTTIDLNKVPLNRAYKIPANKQVKSTEQGKTIRDQKVFASDNKEFIAIAYSYKNDPSAKRPTTEGELKIYDKKGALHWQVKEDSKQIVNCKIANNAALVHVVWYEQSDIPDLYELKSYDAKGNVVFTYKTSAIYSSNDKQRFCFIDEKDYPSIKLVYKDILSGVTWDKSLSGSFIGLIDISSNGNRILVGSDKLYCLNEVGNVIWENPTKYLYCKLSYDGSRVIIINKSKQIQIFDIEANSLLFERDSYSEIHSKFKPTKCSFVENANDYYALANAIGFMKTMVVVFDSSNLIYKQFIIDGTPLLNELRLIETGSNVDVYFDGVKVYSY